MTHQKIPTQLTEAQIRELNTLRKGVKVHWVRTSAPRTRVLNQLTKLGLVNRWGKSNKLKQYWEISEAGRDFLHQLDSCLKEK